MLTATRTQKLLSIGSDAKTIKGEKIGIRTAIFYGEPGDLCPWKSPSCHAHCLYTAGRGIIPTVQRGRIKRTLRFLQDRKGFLADLHRELASHAKTSARKGMEAYARLNGTTDIPWERIDPTLFDHGIKAYDYTKGIDRMLDYLSGHHPSGKPWPASYSLTFSWAGDNLADCVTVLQRQGSVAVPVSNEVYYAVLHGQGPFFAHMETLRKAFPGDWTPVDGDEHDARPLNRKRKGGTLLLLRAKGSARHDTTGWVIR
jgi:hypothetical protein